MGNLMTQMTPARTTILVIDDDAIIRKSLRRFFNERDYAVIDADNGDDGLRQFDEYNPDVVMTDLVMPGMDGLTVLQEIRKRKMDVPVIVISAADATDNVVAALRHGAYDYITKPFGSMTAIENAIENAVARLRQIQSNRTYQLQLESKLKQKGREALLLQQIAAIEHEKHDLAQKRLEETDRLLAVIMNAVTGSFGQELFDQIAANVCAWLGCEFAMVVEICDPETMRMLSCSLHGETHRDMMFPMLKTPCAEVAATGYLEITSGLQEKFPKFGKRFGFLGESYIGVPLTGNEGTVLGTLCAASENAMELPEHVRGVMEILGARAGAEIERLHLENQLRQSQKMEMLGQMASGIVHDHNNLLAGIMGYAEILHNRLNDNDGNLKRYAKTVMDAARRAADLSQRLLRFSRQRGKKRETVNIHMLIDEVVMLLGRTIESRVAISKKMTAPSAYVNGDPTELQNALMNLCLNARDAISGCGMIEIGTRQIQLDELTAHHKGLVSGTYLLVTVSDDGSGMDSATQARIFEPFFTTKGEQKGTGLGLAMVYQSVRQHGGAIQVHSVAGEGTTFSLYFPLLEQCFEKDEIVHESGPACGNGRILVVDDEEMVRNLARDMLTTLGYTIEMAEDGPSAVNFYKEHHEEIDLVLMDLMMPRMNGLETHRQLRKISTGVKTVFCTGYDFDDSLPVDNEPGVCAVIGKPFSICTIAKAVQTSLQSDETVQTETNPGESEQ